MFEGFRYSDFHLFASAFKTRREIFPGLTIEEDVKAIRVGFWKSRFVKLLSGHMEVKAFSVFCFRGQEAFEVTIARACIDHVSAFL